jgi:hypothetical protein
MVDEGMYLQYMQHGVQEQWPSQGSECGKVRKKFQCIFHYSINSMQLDIFFASFFQHHSPGRFSNIFSFEADLGVGVSITAGARVFFF